MRADQLLLDLQRPRIHLGCGAVAVRAADRQSKQLRIPSPAMNEYPNDIHPEYSFATAYTKDGTVYDYVGNRETAITMANEGYRIKVHESDGYSRQEDLQAAVDRELDAAIDCFGEGHRK